MELIYVAEYPLRLAIPFDRSRKRVVMPNLAAISHDVLAYLHRHGVNHECVLSAIDSLSYVLADFLGKKSGALAVCIELPAG